MNVNRIAASVFRRKANGYEKEVCALPVAIILKIKKINNFALNSDHFFIFHVLKFKFRAIIVMPRTNITSTSEVTVSL